MKSANSHRIVFAPDTGVTPAEFVDAWNDLEDCRKEARADLARQGFDPGMAAAWAALAPVAAGLATSLTVELVKRALSNADKEKGINAFLNTTPYPEDTTNARATASGSDSWPGEIHHDFPRAVGDRVRGEFAARPTNPNR